jgi:hypothetical protein
MNIIGESEKFYGYIIGLQVERCPTDQVSQKLLAIFEYNDQQTLWIVPDIELFRILSGHLCSMAEWRSKGDFGYSKLWIKKQDDKWSANVP